LSSLIVFEAFEFAFPDGLLIQQLFMAHL
jgi:hypothetical protein